MTTSRSHLAYRRLIHWPPFWFFILLAMSVFSISFVIFQQHKDTTERETLNELSTIADLKITEIINWRKEREGDALILSQSPFFTLALEKWLQGHSYNDSSKLAFIEQIRLISSAYNYQDVFLFDSNGNPVLSSNQGVTMPGTQTLARVKQSILSKSTLFLDIGAGDDRGGMGIISPILTVHEGLPKVIGVSYLQINPSRFLFPLLKTLPSDNKSMELVLVRREGNDVVFLNTIAADKSTKLPRLPLSTPRLPAAAAILEHKTEFDGVDYRGVPVFASLHPIPNSDWFLIAKVDQKEIYAPLRKMAWTLFGAILLLITLTGFAVGLWWHNQRARFMLSTYQAESARQLERLKDKEELRASESRFRAYFELGQVGMAITTPSHEWLLVNRRFCDMLGYSQDELQSMTWTAMTHPDDLAGDLARFNTLLSGEIEHYEVEKRYFHKLGHLVYTYLAVSCQRKTDGTVDFVIASLQDITERKNQEHLQMARSRLMGAPVNQSLHSLLVATVDEACALTSSCIGFYHFVDPDQKTLTLQAWSTRTIREFCKAEGEGMHYSLDQAGVWVDCVRKRLPIIHNDYEALTNKRGLPPGHAQVIREMVIPIMRNELIVAIIGVGNKASYYDEYDQEALTQLVDLTWDLVVAKHAEEEVRRLNVELEQRVIERTSQLEAANQELESFSYSVSHDLRTPLRAIDGFSRLVLKQYADKLDDEGKRLLNVVRDNTKKMGQLIDDILAFSRAGRLELKTSPIDMDALVHTVWQDISSQDTQLHGRPVEIEINSLPVIQGDAAMLKQVWINLLSNARKFTQNRPEANIIISATTGSNECIYSIRDNGAGFDQQYVHKLFGVFQRLHGVNEFEGTGIGLAIVKRIITRHGGRVWAEGKVNEGATFYFTLPI